jgi:hypothetical protein
MDILLILYSIVLTALLASPFLYIHFNQSKILSRESEEKSTLDSERKMLLENLKDLKIEMDTGKIQGSEFTELSKDIIGDLKELDNRLESIESSSPVLKIIGICRKCNFHTTIAGAKFCAICGSSLLG